MSPHPVSPRVPQAETHRRSITLRTRGHAHGAVTRLISPHDVGPLTKPFVFLDYFEADPPMRQIFASIHTRASPPSP
jgi:hypothetical protein